MFADVPEASALSIGNWVISLAAVLLVVDRAKALFWPNKSSGEESATRNDLASVRNDVASVRNDVAGVRTSLTNYAGRIEIDRVDNKLIDFAKYTTERYDILNNQLHDVRLSQEKLRQDIASDIDRAMQSLGERIDRLLAMKLEEKTVRGKAQT